MGCHVLSDLAQPPCSYVVLNLVLPIWVPISSLCCHVHTVSGLCYKCLWLSFGSLCNFLFFIVAQPVGNRLCKTCLYSTALALTGHQHQPWPFSVSLGYSQLVWWFIQHLACHSFCDWWGIATGHSSVHSFSTLHCQFQAFQPFLCFCLLSSPVFCGRANLMVFLFLCLIQLMVRCLHKLF